jgi:ABC-type nitrate/sulfonate/bicarbonate transport system substrate-binding protein
MKWRFLRRDSVEDVVNRRQAIVGALAGVASTSFVQRSRAATTLAVSVFPGIANLPFLAAQSYGFFKKRGVDVDLKYTPASEEQRGGLTAGRYQIAHSAVDNAVAMVEAANIDVAIVIGGDFGFQRLVVSPEITRWEDIRGKTVLVDAPDTAYGFFLYSMLKQHGLDKADYTVKPVGATGFRLAGLKNGTGVAAMLNPPFSIEAVAAGMKDMGGAVAALGPMQATGGFAQRAWAKANADTLVQYLQGYIDGARWACDPANKTEAIAFYADRFKLAPEVAAECYQAAVDPSDGFRKDAAFSLEGFRNVLRLRTENVGGAPLLAEKYLDLTYYEKALRTI